MSKVWRTSELKSWDEEAGRSAGNDNHPRGYVQNDDGSDRDNDFNLHAAIAVFGLMMLAAVLPCLLMI